MHKNLVALLIFLLTFWSCAALAPQLQGDHQVTTRMALVIAMVDEGSVEISHFASQTNDKAVFNGHVYADKTPGHPFLAVPLIALDKALRQARGEPTNVDEPDVFFDYVRWATIGINCLFTGLAAAAIFLTARRLGASTGAAVFAAFATTLATPLYGWSTAFFAHSLTGSLLLLGLALSLRLFPPREEPRLGQPPAFPSPLRGEGDRRPADGLREMAVPAGNGARLGLGLLLLGLLFGYTAVVDLTAVPALVLLGGFTLLGARHAKRLVSTVLLLGLGGLIGLLPLGIYNQVAFGSPLHLGYGDTSFTGMQQGLYGLTLPNPAVLFELLFGTFRGLLPLSPILLLVPVGLFAMGRRAELRPLAVLLGLSIAAYLWLNASYFYWNGGWSTGPRHLVAMLPVAGLALAFAWPRTLPVRIAVSLLLLVSLGLSLAAALAGMFAPDTIPNEIAGWILPRLADPVVAVRAVLVVPAWLLFALLWAYSARTGSAADPRSAAA